MKLQEPYEARAVRFLEEWAHQGWRMKLYGIAYRRERPRAKLIEASAERRCVGASGGSGLPSVDVGCRR
ncbi:MAG TPA: hypothetical protein VNA19_17485 [Pyrinomonadaceae bacterium]|jgi:hypothetical protein|nr:hypothetical protein [Pyrinomonadaceae bacterium]